MTFTAASIVSKGTIFVLPIQYAMTFIHRGTTITLHYPEHTHMWRDSFSQAAVQVVFLCNRLHVDCRGRIYTTNISNDIILKTHAINVLFFLAYQANLCWGYGCCHHNVRNQKRGLFLYCCLSAVAAAAAHIFCSFFHD